MDDLRGNLDDDEILLGAFSTDLDTFLITFSSFFIRAGDNGSISFLDAGLAIDLGAGVTTLESPLDFSFASISFFPLGRGRTPIGGAGILGFDTMLI